MKHFVQENMSFLPVADGKSARAFTCSRMDGAVEHLVVHLHGGDACMAHRYLYHGRVFAQQVASERDGDESLRAGSVRRRPSACRRHCRTASVRIGRRGALVVGLRAGRVQQGRSRACRNTRSTRSGLRREARAADRNGMAWFASIRSPTGTGGWPGCPRSFSGTGPRSSLDTEAC